MTNEQHLMAACVAMVILVLVVAIRLLQNRIAEMREKRIPPQETANSSQMAARLQNIQAADNYRNLFEAPMLFYALCAVAIGSGYIPNWLIFTCWGFVVLRYLHSLIQCTYNKVMHRFPVFFVGLLVIVFSWIFYGIAYLGDTKM